MAVYASHDSSVFIMIPPSRTMIAFVVYFCDFHVFVMVCQHCLRISIINFLVFLTCNHVSRLLFHNHYGSCLFLSDRLTAFDVLQKRFLSAPFVSLKVSNVTRFRAFFETNKNFPKKMPKNANAPRSVQISQQFPIFPKYFYLHCAICQKSRMRRIFFTFLEYQGETFLSALAVFLGKNFYLHWGFGKMTRLANENFKISICMILRKIFLSASPGP